MLRTALVLLGLLGALPAFAFNHRPQVDSLRQLLDDGDRTALAERTDATLARIVRVAAWALREHELPVEADRLEAEWSATWSGYLPRQVELEALGDHAPLSEWLSETYAKLVALLGVSVCELLHLDDINIVNYAVPVVIHMARVDPDPIDVAEYELHFTPFCGVLAYWGTWAACQVATAGTGWIVVCTPAGMVAEYVVVNYVAPPFAPRCYERFY